MEPCSRVFLSGTLGQKLRLRFNNRSGSHQDDSDHDSQADFILRDDDSQARFILCNATAVSFRR